MKHIITGLFLVLWLTMTALAQGRLEFNKAAHSFGDIQETGGPKQARFTFKNVGNLPVKVSFVQASCGCTTPNWSQAPVAPGDTGFVIAEYNPKGRPGIFNKMLTVHSDGEPGRYELRISGKVIAKPQDPEDIYLDTLGPSLRMITRHISLGTVSPSGGKKEDYFKVFNSTDQPATVTIGSKLPPGLSVRIEPSVIPARTEAVLSVSLDGPARKEYGSIQDDITLLVQGKNAYRRTLSIFTYLEDRPRVLSAEEAKKAPALTFLKEKEVDLGMIEENTVHDFRFPIQNTGNSTLQIFRVKQRYDFLTRIKYPKKLKPGQKGEIRFRYTAKNQSGAHYMGLYLFNNDPTLPTAVVGAKANILRMPKKK